VVEVKVDLFIVGAPKSGTTMLSNCLSAHPDVYMSSPKEPHHFSSDFPRYKTTYSEAEYHSCFWGGERHPGSIWGEASVWYYYSEVAIKNIYKYNPSAKIIYMVRNVVDLLPSLHSQFVFNAEENVDDFMSAWGVSEGRLLGGNFSPSCREPKLLEFHKVGLLGEKLEVILSVFPADQVKVIFYEEFFSDPRSGFLDVLSFLNLGDFNPDSNPNFFSIVNGNKKIRSNRVNYWLRGFDRVLSVPFNAIYSLFGIKSIGLFKIVMRWIYRYRVRESLLSEDRERLRAYFSADIDKLAKLTGRDLSGWR